MPKKAAKKWALLAIPVDNVKDLSYIIDKKRWH